MEIELASGTLADLHPTIGAKRGLVIAPDLYGRRALFDQMAATLAANQNWHVIVIDPFRDRVFSPEDPDDEVDVRNRAVAELDDDEVVGDLVDAADRLEVEPVALVGFGLGGTYAYKAAASLRFDRLVSFYGAVRLPSPWRGQYQREPLTLLNHVDDRSLVMTVVGTDDVHVPPADVDELISIGTKVARFPGAKDNFVHDPNHANHRPKDAADAWSQVLEHLRSSLST